MGMTFNLIDFWAPYKAAMAALNNNLGAASVKSLVPLVLLFHVPFMCCAVFSFSQWLSSVSSASASRCRHSAITWRTWRSRRATCGSCWRSATWRSSWWPTSARSWCMWCARRTSPSAGSSYTHCSFPPVRRAASDYVLLDYSKVRVVCKEGHCCLLSLHCSCSCVCDSDGARAVGEVSKRSRALREQVLSEAKYEPEQTLTLLILTAQFELKLKEVRCYTLYCTVISWQSLLDDDLAVQCTTVYFSSFYSIVSSCVQLLRKMLDQRIQRWDEFKKEGEERLVELSDVYSGRKPLTRIEKNGSTLPHLFLRFVNAALYFTSIWMLYYRLIVTQVKCSQIIIWLYCRASAKLVPRSRQANRCAEVRRGDRCWTQDCPSHSGSWRGTILEALLWTINTVW